MEDEDKIRPAVGSPKQRGNEVAGYPFQPMKGGDLIKKFEQKTGMTGMNLLQW
jgi:hypothetical protein